MRSSCFLFFFGGCTCAGVSVGGHACMYLCVSLIPRPSPALFSWPHMWPLNCPEKREKAWYIFYVIKPQGGLNHDVCGLGFSNYGNVPMRQIAINSKAAQNNSATLPVYSYDTKDSTLDARWAVMGGKAYTLNTQAYQALGIKLL